MQISRINIERPLLSVILNYIIIIVNYLLCSPTVFPNVQHTYSLTLLEKNQEFHSYHYRIVVLKELSNNYNQKNWHNPTDVSESNIYIYILT